MNEANPFDLESFLKNLTKQAGIYQMIDANDKVIYVGKARNLKNRVSSYFKRGDPSPKTRVLVEKIARVEVTVTHSENDALLLENNLIKKLKPRYNILLRDDKSYPYIFISTKHDFPRIDIYRGKKTPPGECYGPFPSAGAVRESLNLLQKIFKIRQCSDSFFNARTRPCLQYQIKRCTAPCVDYIDKESYQKSVKLAQLFLAGKSQEIIDDLVTRMDKASKELDFEQAAVLRDQINALRTVQKQQIVTQEGGDIDVIACVCQESTACVAVMTIRGGRLIGSKSFFPQMHAEEAAGEILAAFIPQYYLHRARANQLPQEIICNEALSEADWLRDFLSEKSERKVKLTWKVRAKRSAWLTMASKNAKVSLHSHLSAKATMYHRLEALQQRLQLPAIPERLECFDISHTSGEATVASCVVFGQEGPINADYRRYNIKGITPGDDYAALRQALMRRYEKLRLGEGKLPDILFIDGGKGQLRQAVEVMEELQISGVLLVGVAKGEGRKPGLETLHIADNGTALHLPIDDVGFLLVQHIRDEAHRFAITGHRQQRDKARQKSVLEEIPGVGAKRRQQLLKQFGGLQGIQQATIEDLNRIPGINQSLAKRIYEYLHEE